MFFEKYIGSIIRHALTTVGGALLIIGADEASVAGLVEAAVPVVSGLVTTSLGLALSLLKEKAKVSF